jgi:translation initiation factor 3 subunit L
MTTEDDSFLPDALKDFVFDLHDSFRTSQIPSEQLLNYSSTFRDLTSKYFEKSPWPSPSAVSSECAGDELFLAIYKELITRHLHSISRPSTRDRVSGWYVYKHLFDLLLKEREEGNPDSFLLIPDWTFDILHEFLYQFQGFCQLRAGTFANAAKYGPGGASEGKTPTHHLTENLDILSNSKDAWAVESVMMYLQRFIQLGSKPDAGTNFQYLAVFSAVTSSRLECLLGDYASSLSALDIINSKMIIQPPFGAEEDAKVMTSEEVVDSVFAAKVSMTYHAGVSYLMLRRYKDAGKVLGDICATMKRGIKSGQFKNMMNADQLTKIYDRMIALLAIITHVCPSYGLVDNSVSSAVREVHGNQLSKIEAGEEGYEDLFMFACPKFVTAFVPEYELAMSQGSSAGPNGQDAYKLQVKHFMNEMANQQTMMKLRSYMKLYSSISVEKLGKLVTEEDVTSLLVSYKQKMRQLENKSGSSGDFGTVMDIHYYVKDDIIHIEEAEKQHRFERYFINQISHSQDILSTVDNIRTDF